MPISDADWSGRDPLAFLGDWCATAAEVLAAQLPAGFAVAGVARPRPQFDAPATDAAPTLTVPARFTDDIGVQLGAAGGAGAAAVRFVTPDNKADSDSALAFAVRVAALLGAGASVVVVDALPGPPSWATHLHSLVGVYPMARRPRGTDAAVLVAAPAPGAFAVWHHSVPRGAPLPTVRVPLSGTTSPNLDLEATGAAALERGAK